MLCGNASKSKQAHASRVVPPEDLISAFICRCNVPGSTVNDASTSHNARHACFTTNPPRQCWACSARATSATRCPDCPDELVAHDAATTWTTRAACCTYSNGSCTNDATTANANCAACRSWWPDEPRTDGTATTGPTSSPKPHC